MQHKISTGITTIKLLDHRVGTVGQYPKFIEELRILRELTIDRDGFGMPYDCNIHQHIQQLPSTLKKLKLRVKNSLHIIYPPAPTNTSNTQSNTQHPTANDLIHPEWTLSSAFPQLETLELDGEEQEWENRDFALIPLSLTSLTLSIFTIDLDEEFSSLLPPHLLALKLSNSTTVLPSFWTHLPPQLTYLNVDAVPYETSQPPSSPLLPHSLTRLKGNYDGIFDLERLPPGLENLSFSWLVNFDVNQPPPIGQILPKLKKVKCFPLSPQLVRLLPACIHTIDMSSRDAEAIDHWPASLTELCGHVSDSLLKTLPRGLVTLASTMDFFDLSDMALLPRTLRHIFIRANRMTTAEEIDFPPHLTYLELVGDYTMASQRFPYSNIPTSVTQLASPTSLPASQLKHLPPRLTYLDTFAINIDTDFDPESAIEIAFMHLNFQNGHREGVEEKDLFESVTRLERASVLALLPRTLRHLKIESLTDNWSMAPPLLETLYCQSPIGLHFLQQLSRFKNLKELYVTLTGVKDDDMKLIPRQIQRGLIRIVNCPSITPIARQRAPEWITLEIAVPGPHEGELWYE